MSNSWNWPGLMAASGVAVQTILVTPSVISPSSVLIGVGSVPFVTSAVHPATGFTDTEATGAFVGRFTSSATVLALAFSLGTRNVIFPYPPWVAEAELTVTWAPAGPAKANTATADTASTRPARSRWGTRITSPVRVTTSSDDIE